VAILWPREEQELFGILREERIFIQGEERED
jgi:hypothetical protein